MGKSKKHSKNRVSSILGITAALLLAGLAVYAGIYMERNTQINAIEFTGNVYTDDETLAGAIESPIGLMADSVRFDQLFYGLKALPYVDDVSVKMSIRGTLTFQISEHEPIAMLIEGPNRAYVSEGGIRLPVMPGAIKNVPLVHGFTARPIADTLNSAAYRQVDQFLRTAKANDIGWITISEVTWNNREGVVALTHENGVRLVFGNDDFYQKMKHWQAFYTDVVARKGIQSFSTIDLRFRDQIVTRNL